MHNTLKVSEAASLAVHALAYLCGNPGRHISVAEISSALGVSQAHLAKVLQRLARQGLVSSSRGPRGGFILGEKGGKISLLEIYESIEGPLRRTDCLLKTRVCSGGDCIFGGLLEELDRQLYNYMAETRLSGLSTLFGGNDDQTQEGS